jgi:hypothetical protein
LSAQKLCDGYGTGLSHPTAIESKVMIGGDLIEPLTNPLKGTTDSTLHKTSSLRETYTQHPICFAFPLTAGVLREK